jgi:hypothetical protein
MRGVYRGAHTGGSVFSAATSRWPRPRPAQIQQEIAGSPPRRSSIPGRRPAKSPALAPVRERNRLPTRSANSARMRFVCGRRRCRLPLTSTALGATNPGVLEIAAAVPPSPPAGRAVRRGGMDAERVRSRPHGLGVAARRARSNCQAAAFRDERGCALARQCVGASSHRLQP